MRTANHDVIIACDFGTETELMDFLMLFEKDDSILKPYVKIGMEAFYANGPEIVKKIKAMGHKIFLDLKLHDIPNTVGKSMKVLGNLHVDMVNVHAAGGNIMMKAAREALDASSPETILLAVTQLTSTGQDMLQSELLINHSMEETVTSYAKNAVSSGCNGIICSPLEAGLVKKACGKDVITVTPGIRFAEDAAGDQTRITTPADADKKGSDFIVMGRSITGAKDPVAAYRKALQEFCGE